MLEYLFRGEKEYVKIKVDKDRTIFISNRMTNNNFVKLEPKLFGGNREKIAKLRFMTAKVKKITEEELDVYLVLEFLKMGYTLIKKGDKVIKNGNVSDG